jgi:hypothetical protein
VTSIDFTPAVDALGRISRLEYGAVLSVLGIATEFRSNSQYVLDVVEDAFGAWRRLPTPIHTDLRSTVRVVVIDGDEGGAGRAVIRHLCPDPQRIILHSFGSIGVSDPARRESVAYVTTALAADRDHFRVGLLEALTFALLSDFDRHPLHAGAIARDGRALLLVGESGAGKSTLTYLARSAGYDVLAEDHAWIQLDPDVRVWGSATHVRLGSDAIEHFPDVSTSGVTTTVGAKTKFAVDVSSPTSALVATNPIVCILSRADDNPWLEPINAGEVAACLTSNVSPGFDRFPARHRRAVEALAASGGWRLHLSSDPREAVPFLEAMFAG